MRYLAPINVSAIWLSSGEKTVDDTGHIEVETLTDGDSAGLAANGFTLAADAPQPKKGDKTPAAPDSEA